MRKGEKRKGDEGESRRLQLLPSERKVQIASFVRTTVECFEELAGGWPRKHELCMF